MGRQTACWGGALWLVCCGVQAQSLSQGVVPVQEAPVADASPEAGAVVTDAAVEKKTDEAAEIPPAHVGLLARWRQRIDRQARIVTGASAFSLSERDGLPEGALRFRPVDPAQGGKPDIWSLKANSDYADLRQALRGRVLQWQPMAVGDWKLGASIGSTRALASASADRSTYAVMPMASLQSQRYEWRVGVMPSSRQTDTTLVVRLRVKAF